MTEGEGLRMMTAIVTLSEAKGLDSSPAAQNDRGRRAQNDRRRRAQDSRERGGQ
jgi:hypothetical protein